MTNADRKAAIRERMASTGESYTTAKRTIEQARSHGRERVMGYMRFLLSLHVTAYGFMIQSIM